VPTSVSQFAVITGDHRRVRRRGQGRPGRTDECNVRTQRGQWGTGDRRIDVQTSHQNMNSGMTFTTCPFFSLPESRIVQSNEIGWMIRDAHPISPGHTLIIPKRHVGSFFDLTEDERSALLSLLATAKRRSMSSIGPTPSTSASMMERPRVRPYRTFTSI
jgi:hypothetical protein